MASKTVKSTGNYVRHTVELPRPIKRIISVCFDALMMPLALWAAISLKAGYPVFKATHWPAYAIVVAVSIPVFVRLGLYRAVIRFLGHQAVFAVAFAIAVSGLLLGILGEALQIPALSWSVVTIYSCLALLYVAGSRFVVRYYLLTRLRSADRGEGGHLWRRRCGREIIDRALDHARVRSPGLHRRCQEPARPHGQRHQGVLAGGIAWPHQGLGTSTASCWPCPR